MKLFLRVFSLLSVFALAPVEAAEDDDARMRAVAAEVAARRLIHEHESGTKKATESELAAARELLRRNAELRAKEPPVSVTDAQRTRLKALTAEVEARRLLFENMAGKKTATDAELAAARALVKKRAEARAREVAPGPDGTFKAEMADADMSTVTKVFEGVYGFAPTVTERLKNKRVSFAIADASLEAFQEKLRVELKKAGVFLRFRPDGAILDAEPDKYGPR